MCLSVPHPNWWHETVIIYIQEKGREVVARSVVVQQAAFVIIICVFFAFK